MATFLVLATCLSLRYEEGMANLILSESEEAQIIEHLGVRLGKFIRFFRRRMEAGEWDGATFTVALRMNKDKRPYIDFTMTPAQRKGEVKTDA